LFYLQYHSQCFRLETVCRLDSICQGRNFFSPTLSTRFRLPRSAFLSPTLSNHVDADIPSHLADASTTSTPTFLFNSPTFSNHIDADNLSHLADSVLTDANNLSHHAGSSNPSHRVDANNCDALFQKYDVILSRSKRATGANLRSRGG
jgi:hypothetical protein